jgi:hypothetical protein
MGLFKKIKKKFKKVVKPVKRITAGVATGGLTEVLRATGNKDIATALTDAFVPTNLTDAFKTASLALAPATGGLSLTASNIAGQTTLAEGTTGGIPMSLGNVLGGLQGVLSQVSNFGGPVGTVAAVGSGFLSGFLPAQGPVAAQFPQQQFPQATMTMSAAPIIRGAATAVTAFVAPVLAKMSLALGKNITLRAAMIIIRRLGKTLSSPAAVAAAVGLTLSELSQLLTANAIKGSSGRRMNPGNVKALRRAHRRIKSFHRLCGDNDRLRAPRRRASPKVINVRGGVC